MGPDARPESAPRKVNQPDREWRTARSPSLALDGEPDFTWVLRCQAVEAERGKQAYDALRHGLGHFSKAAIRGYAGIRQRIEPAPDPREGAARQQPLRILARNIAVPQIAGTDDPQLAGQGNDAAFDGFHSGIITNSRYLTINTEEL